MELKLPHYIKSIKSIYQKIHKQKLLESFKAQLQHYFDEGNNERNELLVFLKDMFAMSNLAGISFLQALLKDPYYEWKTYMIFAFLYESTGSKLVKSKLLILYILIK